MGQSSCKIWRQCIWLQNQKLTINRVT
jgi:hypothetical protein